MRGPRGGMILMGKDFKSPMPREFFKTCSLYWMPLSSLEHRADHWCIAIKNLIPFDHTTPQVTSDIRLGTAAIMTRGLAASDILLVVEWIDHILKNTDNKHKIKSVKEEVNRCMRQFILNTL